MTHKFLFDKLREQIDKYEKEVEALDKKERQRIYAVQNLATGVIEYARSCDIIGDVLKINLEEKILSWGR